MPEIGSPLLGRLLLSERTKQAAEKGVRGRGRGSARSGASGAARKAGGDQSPEIEQYALRKGIAYWHCKLSFYGPPKANEANWEFAKEKFSAIPGVKIRGQRVVQAPADSEQRDKVHKPQFGIPSLAMFSRGARSETNPSPTNGHIWFSPIVPRTGEAIFEANRVFSQAAVEYGLPNLALVSVVLLGKSLHLYFCSSDRA